MVEHPQKQAHHVLVLPLLPIECDSWFLEREDPLLGMCGKEQGQMPEERFATPVPALREGEITSLYPPSRAAEPQARSREGKGYIAVPACGGGLVEAKRSAQDRSRSINTPAPRLQALLILS
eukprot:1159370-Pelagomonas_calceolata.AAC.2